MPGPSKKRMKLDKNHSRVVIVGGGLGGLSAALALEKAGFTQISLFERDESFEQQKEGYGLTLTYNPKGPLAALGILEQVAQQDCPSRSHYLFRSDGSILGYFGNAFSKHRGSGQRGNLRVPRKVLRRILMDQLQTTTIHWGHWLVDYSFNFDHSSQHSQYHVQFHETLKRGSADGAWKTKTKLQPNKTVVADLLIAADGIRSAVLSKIYRSKALVSSPVVVSDDDKEITKENATVHETGFMPREMGLRYMGVRLILGIADFSHPLLNERGFYTLDGKHRLFTMPYSSNRFSKTKQENRIMWQLSFATGEESSSSPSMRLDATYLRDYVVRTCRTWHDPVIAMVEATPIETIWGTDLMDRDPKQTQAMIQNEGFQRLVVVGDALHSMSPFKGQGANQALADGPLLASCLEKSSIDAAVTNFWREAVQRTAPVVAASRKAAKELHSPSILHNHGFAGVRQNEVAGFVETLRQRKIDTSRGETLDLEVLRAIEECGVEEVEQARRVCPKEQQKALQHAACGDTPSLRIQSLAKHSESIRTALDDHSRTCLHLAARGGHPETCRWLLTEIYCDPRSTDSNQKTPVDYAVDEPSVISLFELFGQSNG